MKFITDALEEKEREEFSRLKVIKKHPEWVKQAHDLGLKVNVWTVNKEEDMQAMLDLGVDFITTNNPVELKALIGK